MEAKRSTVREPEPISIVLELVRTEDGEDPYSFEFKPQAYGLRNRRGGYQDAKFSWDTETAAALQSIQSTRPDPLQVADIGRRLQGFLPGGALQEERILA